MKREYSLKGASLFQEIFDNGVKLQKKGVQIITLKKNRIKRESVLTKINDGHIQIGIVIAKKIGKANIRNTFKRRIRAICRDYLPELDNHCCLIIRPGKNFYFLRYHEQKNILASLFQKSGLLVDEKS
ncbi:MAG TPA: ribonuclease P protein component [Spirochaetota bacterium]|nr:ribonuclease P protein component [Spirochaetota bacterium]HPI89553.1 ribonuclease P protein component [Spirochaetota bacterium]HPR49017.1 ribonuclease P protein component [Spirochaetota bacterium]